MNILVADDELRLRKIVVLHLSKSGHSVTEANNGKNAINLLRTYAFDVAILDVSMPEMTGIEVISKMAEEGIKTPIVFLSANATVDEVKMGLSKGAVAYLTKPFSLRELSSTIENIKK